MIMMMMMMMIVNTVLTLRLGHTLYSLANNFPTLETFWYKFVNVFITETVEGDC